MEKSKNFKGSRPLCRVHWSLTNSLRTSSFACFRVIPIFVSFCFPVQPLALDDTAHQGREFVFTAFPGGKAGAQGAARHGERFHRREQDAGPGGVQLLCLFVEERVVADVPARDHEAGQSEDVLLKNRLYLWIS